MANKTSNNGLQRTLHHLAGSVFELSDEEILAEVRESGIDPQEEADRTSFVLRQAVDRWESENERLSELGHTINPNRWRFLEGEYHNYCLSCGSAVSFTTATGEMLGEALAGSCDKLFSIKRRNGSRSI